LFALCSCATEDQSFYTQVEGAYGHHKICVTGPQLSESSKTNPFTDVRLLLKIEDGPEGKMTIPGYFAADGNAAESGASSGNQWCVHARGFAKGVYQGTLYFEQGEKLALYQNNIKGEPLKGNGESVFLINVEPKEAVDGWLQYSDSPYPRFSESGKMYLKSGTNSPENLLAFADIDGTYAYDTTKQFIKTYASHIADWNPGDPTWQNGKGKGLIGALNYLASEGINGVYFVTNNIGGDARDVWFVTQETENETMLDEGEMGLQRSLYYRELLARFGYHSSIVWNLGEENGKTPWSDDPYQTDEQRKDMAAWFAASDPYKHPIVIHTLPESNLKAPILKALLGNEDLAGVSYQTSNKTAVHDDMVRWRHASDSAGHSWMLAMDEIGPWHTGSQSDAADPAHDTLRKNVLWGSFMAGAYGVEWYFGWRGDQHDLNAEDFRSRQNLWRQTKHCVDFFQEFELLLDEMRPADHLVGENAWCLANPSSTYIVYLPNGGTTTLDLSAAKKTVFGVYWTNPKTGVRQEATSNVTGGEMITLAAPTSDQDWVATLL